MNPATPIVHVVDDDESFTLAVGRLLRAAGYQVQTYASGSDFLMAGSRHGPGCLLLDVKMPGSDGLELQTALANGRLSLPIIFISGRSNIPIAVRALKAGAIDFLTKPVCRQVLLRAVSQAVIQDAERRAERAQMAGLRSRYESLSAREHDVFTQVITGKLNKQIAAELGASERTVKAHRAHIMEKMRVNSVAELVHIADQLMAATK
jgi:FixJ family two-component response regulator